MPGGYKKEPCSKRGHGSTPAASVVERIEGAAVVLSNKVGLDRAAFAASPGLRLVVVMATGTNNVDLEAAREHGVVVCNVRGGATQCRIRHGCGRCSLTRA